MKKSKNLKFFSLVTVFCLVVAYFSVLSPTTAYFYNQDEQRVDVTFYNLSTQQNISNTAVSFNLKAATKFEDFDELLFDDVVYSQFVTVTNSGEVPAVVYLTVDIPAQCATNGLKYIVFPTAVVSSPMTPTFVVGEGSDANKGNIKELIEGRLYLYNNSFVSGISTADAVTILDSFNSRTRNFNTAPLLDVGQSVGFQIYFWAEYGNIEGTISNTTAISSYTYSANVIVSARQNNSAAA